MQRAANNTDRHATQLSVVATTSDRSFVEELEHALSPETELIVVSTEHVAAAQAHVVQVVALESAYRRNRGLAEAHGDVVAFLEDGQLPHANWGGAVLEAFDARPRPAAVVASGLPLRAGGNVAYDRGRLLDLRGFRLFTGAEPGSPVPDLLALLALESRAAVVATSGGMQLVRGGAPPPRDGRLLGRVLRRKPRLVLRRLASELRGGAARDAFDLLAGAVHPEQPRHPTPEQISPIPPRIEEALGRRALVPLDAPQKAKLHFFSRADGLMVHLYVSPDDHLRDAVAAHEAIVQRATVSGIPRVHAWEEEVDCFWLVEDDMPGTPIDPRTLDEARDELAGWVCALGGPPTTPLASSARWQAHRIELLQAQFPDEVHKRLAASLDAVQHVPARHLHGDLNPRNVLVAGSRFAAVDWENAAIEFLPGLDLVFLFLLADRAPDEQVVLAPGPLARHLHTLGIDERLLPHALRVMLATWALGERNRRARLGVDPGPKVFEALYFRCEAALD